MGWGFTMVTKMCPWLTSLLAVLYLSWSVGAQSETESKFVLADIVAFLPGQFDNEPQIFLQDAFGAGDDGSHRRMYFVAEAVGKATAQSADFLISYRYGDRAAPLAASEVWSFDLSADVTGVRMRRYPATPSTKTAVEPDIAAMKANDPLPCELVWFQGQGSLFAEPARTDCENEAYDIILGEEGLWIRTRGTVTGKLSEPREDGVYTKLFRAREMECFVNVLNKGAPRDAGLEGRTLINPIMLHDRGDSFAFSTDEEAARQFTLKVRRSMWPSRSGRNFVPMLILYLYEGDVSANIVAGSAWASADSGRVAFDAQGVGARCKNAD